MATIGSLFIDPKTGHAKGNFKTLAMAYELAMQPLDHDGKDANRPTHAVALKARHGDFVEVGSAWKKIGQRGNLAGKPFYSISIDDPDLDKPINIFAYPNPHGPREKDGAVPYELVWHRERGAGAEG